jgi:hypothetical protein
VSQLEVGWYDDDGERKYCIMQLHRRYGRRPGNLANIVTEYNAVARVEFKLQLSKERTANGGLTPSLYLFKVGSVNHQLLAKVMADRTVKPPTYQVWYNPLRDPVAVPEGVGRGITGVRGGAPVDAAEEGGAAAGGGGVVEEEVAANGGVDTEEDDN